MAERILIVEDEENLARFVELELSHEGYSVTKAFTGRHGLDEFEKGQFDLILLDIMLPELSGLEVLRRIRKSSQMPVILLTARDSVSDKVGGLDGGADDYITKPFAIEELLARIRAALRQKPAQELDSVLTIGELRLDSARREVSYADKPIELTKREFDLLRVMMENTGLVMTRDTLLRLVWSYDYAGETNVVDVYVRYLRNKIDLTFDVKLLHTIRGVGYVLKLEESQR